MNKYTVLLILNLLILCVILLQYYGIIRYIKLHLNSTENYIENFKKLKSNKDKKLSVFINTSKDNLHKLKPIINSLLDQTIKINDISLIVNLENADDYNSLQIPSYIKLTSNVIPSYDNSNLLQKVFTHEKNKNTILLKLDDKKVYGKDYIESLLDEYKKCSSDGSVVMCGDDMLLKNSGNLPDSNKGNVKKINYSENYSLFF
jgi:hypothetical protein